MAVTQNGVGEMVQGLVLGLRGANAREVVEGVKAKLDDIATALPDGVTVRVFYDRGDLVAKAVGTVSKALAEAIVLVLILLVLFLGDLRAALTVALVLPLAALVTFFLNLGISSGAGSGRVPSTIGESAFQNGVKTRNGLPDLFAIFQGSISSDALKLCASIPSPVSAFSRLITMSISAAPVALR